NGIDLNNIQAWKSPDDGTTWFQVGAPTSTSTNPRSITVENVTSLSDWTVGEPIFTSTSEEIDFGVCSQYSTQSQQITITNESLSAISGTAIISDPYSVAIVTDNGDYAIPDGRSLDANDDNRTSKQQLDDSRNTLVIPSIPASGSVTLQITYNPTLTGIHDDVLLLSFSGAGSPSKEIIVTGTTVATPEIQVAPVSIAFGDVYVGESFTDQFTIENTGSGVLTGNITTPTGYSVAEVTDDSSANDKKDFKEKQTIRFNSSVSNEYRVIDSRNTLGFSIDPGITATYDLTFSPSGTGDLNGTVTISNNAGANETISVTGRGVTVVVGTDPSSFTKTIQRENSTSDILEISNSSNGTLTYTASISYLDDTRSIDTVSPASTAYWTGTCTSTTKIDDSESRGKGGAVDTRETGWMMFDISGLPDNAIVYSIEFHGYVNDTNWPYWSITPCLDKPDTTNAATLSTNIHGNAGSAQCYLYENAPSTYTTGWKQYNLGGNAIADFENALANDWFAVGIAERDGSNLYYLNFDGWNESNPPYLEIEYTTPDKNWLTINNAMRVQGSISGTTYDEISVDFNSAGISDGTYSANINVASNDPITPSVDIAVSLTVETPEITVSPLTFDYGYIETGTTSSQQFTIQNTGNALLEGYITTPTSFTVSLSSDGADMRQEGELENGIEEDGRATTYYSVVAGVTNTYNLIFAPTAIADYSGTVTISDNCPESDFSISVTAHGDEPDLNVTPASFDVTLTNFAISSETLTLENTSNIEVTYEASIYTEKVYPLSGDYWTGTCTNTAKTDVSEVRGYDTEDGWMKFNVSEIPSNATITGISFNGYVNDTYFPWWSITPVS
ncbi:MAG: hypothetical protein DRP49_09370, partial [Spirochaetes bacterium]